MLGEILLKYSIPGGILATLVCILMVGNLLAETSAEAQKENVIGYCRPGTSETGGARNLLLVYSRPSKERPRNWTKETFRPYVTYLDKNLSPKDSFFDSFLFLPTVWGGESSFQGDENPSRAIDWERYLDGLFDPRYQLSALDTAIEEARKIINYPKTVPVFIAIPFPSKKQTQFGNPDGIAGNLDFGDPQEGLENREKAVSWYIHSVLKRWKQSKFRHLKLVGFYWFEEKAPEIDFPLLRSAAGEIHSEKLNFLWIPWYCAPGYQKWKELGFDSCIMQPNLSFTEIPPEEYEKRIQSTATEARKYGMGIEIELGNPAADEVVRNKYMVYLKEGDKWGYRKGAFLGYYQNITLLGQCAQSSDPLQRELYDATYRFIRK